MIANWLFRWAVRRGWIQGPATIKDLERMLPKAAFELVGDRQEVVIYTGWTVCDDGTLVDYVETPST